MISHHERQTLTDLNEMQLLLSLGRSEGGRVELITDQRRSIQATSGCGSAEFRGVYGENRNLHVRKNTKLGPVHQTLSRFERLRFPSGANLGPASFGERYCRALFIRSNYIPAL